MQMCMFLIEPTICDYRKYGLIWNIPIVGEELACKREFDNGHNPYTETLHAKCKTLYKLKADLPKFNSSSVPTILTVVCSAY